MRLWYVLFIVYLFISNQANALVTIPAYSQPVVDVSNTLTTSQIAQLEQQLQNYTVAQDDGAQIAILLVPTLDNEPIEQFADRVFKQWQIGQKGKDNGILFVIAKNDRQVRIEVGYGLESELPDLAAKRIIDRDFIPAFKQNNYYQGIDDALVSVINVLTHVDSAPLLSKNSDNTPSEWRLSDVLSSPFGMTLLYYSIVSYIICMVLVTLLPIRWLKKSTGRKHLAIGLLNGMSAGGYTLSQGLPLFIVLPVLFLVFVVSTIFSALPSRNGGGRGGRGNGSSGFGGSNSRGGFGGGGGGRSGGGGASGRW